MNFFYLLSHSIPINYGSNQFDCGEGVIDCGMDWRNSPHSPQLQFNAINWIPHANSILCIKLNWAIARAERNSLSWLMKLINENEWWSAVAATCFHFVPLNKFFHSFHSINHLFYFHSFAACRTVSIHHSIHFHSGVSSIQVKWLIEFR